MSKSKSKKVFKSVIETPVFEVVAQPIRIPEPEPELHQSFNVNNLVNNLIEADDEAPEVDEFGLPSLTLVKKSTYTQAHRIAQQKYREKFPEKYCELQRKLYADNKENEEWKKKFNERGKLNNKIYRDKKKAEKIAQGIEIKPRGRPRKVKTEEVCEEADDATIQSEELCANDLRFNN